MLHVGDAPVKLLRSVRDLNLLELPNKEQCCGFGGTFAVKNPDVSVAMLTQKDACVVQTGAEIVTALDNSCLMQIYGGLHRSGSKVRTLHLAEILESTGGLA
jgi:L-lactate dehydrogenase complex protein LldE